MRQDEKVKRIPLARMSESQLLSLRLCDLRLEITGSSLEPLIDQVLDELKAKGLNFRPHFWVSDEWFCPDGIGGVAVPFFVLHPRLRSLERAIMGEVEGGDRRQALKIIRHEVGHALDNAFRLRKERERQEVFGPSQLPYPESYSPRPYSRHFVSHLQPSYAQSHPLEDFAETFAVWLNPESQWRQRYRGWPALEKLLYVDKRMRALRGERAQLKTRSTYQPLHRLKSTLAEHYRQRLKSRGLLRPSAWDNRLREIFSRRSAHAEQVLRSLRREASQEVAKALGEYQYRIDSLVHEMCLRARHMEGSLEVFGSRFKKTAVVPKSLKRDLLDLMTERSLEALQKDSYRIPM